MNEKDFLDLCKEIVCNYTNTHLDKSDNKQITTDDVFMVWCCKTLQNNKALLSTTLFDGMYYECTYNGDKDELYFDAYKKWQLTGKSGIKTINVFRKKVDSNGNPVIDPDTNEAVLELNRDYLYLNYMKNHK